MCSWLIWSKIGVRAAAGVTQFTAISIEDQRQQDLTEALIFRPIALGLVKVSGPATIAKLRIFAGWPSLCSIMGIDVNSRDAERRSLKKQFNWDLQGLVKQNNERHRPYLVGFILILSTLFASTEDPSLPGEGFTQNLGGGVTNSSNKLLALPTPWAFPQIAHASDIWRQQAYARSHRTGTALKERNFEVCRRLHCTIAPRKIDKESSTGEPS